MCRLDGNLLRFVNKDLIDNFIYSVALSRSIDGEKYVPKDLLVKKEEKNDKCDDEKNILNKKI